MAIEGLTADLRVVEVLRRWPRALHYFLVRRFACLGCSMAAFCSLRAVSADYRVPIEQLMADLEDCILGRGAWEERAEEVHSDAT